MRSLSSPCKEICRKESARHEGASRTNGSGTFPVNSELFEQSRGSRHLVNGFLGYPHELYVTIRKMRRKEEESLGRTSAECQSGCFRVLQRGNIDVQEALDEEVDRTYDDRSQMRVNRTRFW